MMMIARRLNVAEQKSRLEEEKARSEFGAQAHGACRFSGRAGGSSRRCLERSENTITASL